jgi:hypothetical protein
MSKAKIANRLERLFFRVHGEQPVKKAPSAKANPATREPRIPAFKFGHINFAGGTSVQCMILDLSKKGARISLSGAVNLPKSVRLSIPQHAIKINATVSWQRGQEAGLQFETA